MLNLILAVLTLDPARAEAPAFVTVKYQIHGEWVDFVRDEKQHLTLSAGCKARHCLAFKALSKASLTGLDDRLKGGAQPGAVICSKRLHATLQTGQDEQGNETGFCKFKDGSLVGTGSLSYYATRKSGLAQ